MEKQLRQLERQRLTRKELHIILKQMFGDYFKNLVDELKDSNDTTDNSFIAECGQFDITFYYLKTNEKDKLYITEILVEKNGMKLLKNPILILRENNVLETSQGKEIFTSLQIVTEIEDNIVYVNEYGIVENEGIWYNEQTYNLAEFSNILKTNKNFNVSKIQAENIVSCLNKQYDFVQILTKENKIKEKERFTKILIEIF